MRPSLFLAAFLALLGLTLNTALAQAGGQPPAPAAAAQPPATGHEGHAHAPIPVPDGPVLNRQELEGGLVIEDIKLGEGREIKEGATVTTYYHGTLRADPSVVIDSAFERGEPATLPLKNMIQGWQKGVPGMRMGGVRRLTIPAALAWGPRAQGKIPANADVVFVIQLEVTPTLEDITSEDIKVGEGEEAKSAFVAVTAQTITDAEGKRIEQSDAAHPYIWIPGEMFIPALGTDAMQHAMKGMKVGGKRKITIPKELNTSPPQAEVKRPQNIAITIEVELLAVRNLPQQQPQPRGR